MFSKNITQEELDLLKEEHEAILLSLNNSKALLATKETELKEKQSEIDNIALKIDEQKALLLTTESSHEAQKEALEEIIVELQKDIAEKELELASVSEEAVKAKNEHKDFLAQAEATKAQKELELSEQVKSDKSVLHSLSTLKESLDQDIKEKKEAQEALSKKIIANTNQLAEIENQTALIEQRIREDAELSVKRVAEAENKVSLLTEQVSDLNNQLDSLVDEISDLQKAKKIAEQELTTITEKNKTELQKSEELKKRHMHVIQKEEYLREKYEVIGEVYPEFKI